MSDSSRFIDGIFNYCDRWCERCSMTRHCRVYEIEQAIEESTPGETETREFWDTLNERLELEMDHANTWADELLAQEPPTEEEMEEFLEEEEWRDQLIASTDLFESTEAYRREVMAWLKNQMCESSIRVTDAARGQRTPLNLADALDIVAWYHMQIAAKVHRALHGREEHDWSDDAVQNDWNGSAKVALLGVERSIGAWSFARDHLPGEEALIRRFIARCGLIRRLLLEKFPDAREFVRPGFDDQ